MRAVPIEGQRLMSGVLLNDFPPEFLRTGHSLKLELGDAVSLASQLAQVTCLPLLPNTGFAAKPVGLGFFFLPGCWCWNSGPPVCIANTVVETESCPKALFLNFMKG